MMTVRRTIRIKAFQALFQLNNNFQMTTDQAIKHALTYSLNKEEEEIDNLDAIKHILPVKNVDDQMAEENLAYLIELVTGVQENQKFLDEQLEKRLKNWSIQRIEITNLLILRLAAYELYFHEEIDPSIVINEAIEITKSFNNDHASKFVNGVLQGILDAKEV
ncbi:MAG TPA: transcription antitermination factor NusB [Candidatus Atopostipes pullistercoris]|uniref:Transcription antitermination protein NusB n=1 Tax=Candidatus Atopostipes pullistercoris TaxID=2838467 RepID=A0A9D2G286_9LACT|nr:transcription antitermination factor NusB [Candidatus Atopostipes pullistercoris]